MRRCCNVHFPNELGEGRALRMSHTYSELSKTSLPSVWMGTDVLDTDHSSLLSPRSVSCNLCWHNNLKCFLEGLQLCLVLKPNKGNVNMWSWILAAHILATHGFRQLKYGRGKGWVMHSRQSRNAGKSANTQLLGLNPNWCNNYIPVFLELYLRLVFSLIFHIQ